MMLALSQTAMHLYCDYDHLPIPVAKRNSESKDLPTHPVTPIMKRLQSGIIQIIIDALRKGLIVTLASPFIYVLFLRRSAWSFSLYFAKLFWNFSRAAADPPGTVPPAFYTLFVRQIISGGCLVFLWQTANLLFTVFLTQEPLKRGQPLTFDTKDPNGSLINGLKAKKDIVKTYAFWELCFISQRYADRRKAIFDDIERGGGPAWKQMLQVSVENISGITSRINNYKNPTPTTVAKDQSVTYPQIQALPQLTDTPKQENIFAPSPKASGFGHSFGATAKSFGQSPDWTPVARAKAKDAFSQASNAILSPERKKKLLGGTDEVKLLTGPKAASQSSFNLSSIPFVAQFLRSPIGKPFRQAYAQRLRGIVFGEPHGQVASIVDAIESVTRLLIASLEEDKLGQVQTDVPGVVRLFTETIIILEDFVQNGLDIHWTDVTFPSPNNNDPDVQKKAKYVPEVDIVLSMLRTSLSDLLASFEKYSRDIRLQAKDIRLAKAAAGLLDKGDNDHDDNDDPFTSKH
jgi:nucleoporin NDC1